MKGFLALLFVVGAASADLSAVVDSILRETRSRIRDDLFIPALNDEADAWDPNYTKFTPSARIETSAGKVALESFGRERAPMTWGHPMDGGMEIRFFIDGSTITYDTFFALNYTSGEKSEGQLTVDVGVTDMYLLLKTKPQGNTCTTVVSTLTPISIGETTPKFSPESKLAQNLWTDAKSALNAPINSTIVRAVWPEFEKVLAESDLCKLLP